MKKREFYIYIDDVRQPVNPDWIWVKSYREAINYLVDLIDYLDVIDDAADLTIDFDHDLGEDKSGYDIAKWLVEQHIIANFRVHTMNPVGRQNIRQLLLRYGWKEIF